MVETTVKLVLCGVLYTKEIGPFLLFLLLKTYRGGPISIVYNTVDHTELLYYCFQRKYPGSKPLPYFMESQTSKTYPVLGKSHNPVHPKRSGLRKHIPF